jgi:hypothetical protein
MTNKIIGGILVVLVLGLAGVYWLGVRAGDTNMPVVQNFQECVDAGYPVMETYPEQCRTPDGRTFVNPDQVAPNTPDAGGPSTGSTNSPQTGAEEPVFCTADAYQCPDGSWVGRMGPNCEFVCPATQNPVACTLEAKICPDGSAVGRTGPNCEFAPCPGQ